MPQGDWEHRTNYDKDSIAMIMKLKRNFCSAFFRFITRCHVKLLAGYVSDAAGRM